MIANVIIKVILLNKKVFTEDSSLTGLLYIVFITKYSSYVSFFLL